MNLQLAIKEMFEGNEVEVYWNDQNEPVMTIQQLAKSLEYADRSGVDKIVQRNQYLDSIEFSVADKLSSTDGKKYDTRIFNEDGIYEITILSQKPKAKEFRAFVRKVLKSLRKGEVALTQSQPDDDKLEIQRMKAQASLNNSQVRKAKHLEGIAQKFGSRLGDESIQSLLSHSTHLLTGRNLIPMPKIEERHYTATEVGEELGVSAHKVGSVANKNDLKKKEFGMMVLDKAKYSNKQVESFRYNEKGKERLRELLGGGDERGIKNATA